MNKSFLLACSNIRKAKAQTASIIVLTMLAASMLQLWLMLSMDYKQNFERCHDKLNAQHVMLAVDDGSDEMRGFLTQMLTNDTRIAEFSLDSSMNMVGTFEYNGGKLNSELVFLERQAALSRPIGRAEIVCDSEFTSGVYLPILYQSDDIAIGKTIEISIETDTMTYTICGFFNSVMAGSHNCALCEIILTKDKYQELEKAGCAPKATLCSIRLKDKTESERYEALLKNAISSVYPTTRMISNSYGLVSQSRYISQMICSGIIGAMAFFILVIVLVAIASNIINYIGENMKNLGVLKAVGYTSRQLVSALLLQFFSVSLAASFLGAGISYCLFPFINAMMISQTGIPYQVHFLPLPFAATLLLLGGTVVLTVGFSSRRISRIEPIVALRQGISVHNFRRNFFPLATAKAPLQLALALKTTFASLKYNVTVCITMLVLSLVLVFSGLMSKNLIADATPFIQLIVGEMADSLIDVNADAEETFLQEMDADYRVIKTYLYHAAAVRHKDGIELTAVICDDCSKLNNQDYVYEGRFPKYDNEIAIAAKYAKEKGLVAGNEITISADGKEATYLISGFTQVSNYLGKDCLMTRAAYERLGELPHTSYYLNLLEGTDIDAFHAEVKAAFPNSVNTAINFGEMLNSVSVVYVSLMTIIVIAILILSALVVAFILYLLVRTMLGSKKRDYGVLKALGFTTGQLILQTALIFMPAMILSTAAGVTIASLIINPLTALFLSGIGIVKSTFTVPVGLIASAAIGLVLFAFAVVCLLSIKIRKITPKELLIGE